MKKLIVFSLFFVCCYASEEAVQHDVAHWRITPNELFGLLQTPVPAHRIGSLVQRAARVVAFNPALLKKADRLSSDVQETIAVEWARHTLGDQLKNIKKGIPYLEMSGCYGICTEFFQDGDAVVLYKWPSDSEVGDIAIVVDKQPELYQGINAPALSTKITKKTNIHDHARLNDQEIVAYYCDKEIGFHKTGEDPIEPIEHGIINIVDRKNRESRLLFAVEGDADMGTFKVAPNGDIMTLFGCQRTHSYKEGTIPTLKVWDSKTGVLKWQLSIRGLDKENNFLINDQGELLARNVDNDICLWDETGNLKNIIAKDRDAKSSGFYLIDNGDTTGIPTFGYVEGVKEVHFLPHGDVLLMCDKQLKIVDPVTLQEKFRLDTSNGFSKVRLFPNGPLCVEEGFIPSTLHFIDTNAYRVTKSVHVGNTHHSLSENSLRVLSDGRLLLSCDNNQRIFNMETGSEYVIHGTRKMDDEFKDPAPDNTHLYNSMVECEMLPTGDIITVDYAAFDRKEVTLWDGFSCTAKKRIKADTHDVTRRLGILPIGYIVSVENNDFVLREPYALQEIYRKKCIPEDEYENLPEDFPKGQTLISVDAHINNDFSITRNLKQETMLVKLSTTLRGLCHKLFPAGEVSMKTMCEVSEQVAQEGSGADRSLNK